MYGPNGGQLRDAMATLLRQHRVQQRLGGAGLHSLPQTTTAEERKESGVLIMRYRRAVLIHCRTAVAAVNPSSPLGGTSVRSRNPAQELRYRLDRALKESPVGLPTLNELMTSHEFELVELWRSAAQAAALGEHDFPAGVSWVTMTDEQCRTVLKDAAEVTQGLVVLDRRYKNIPGWKALRGCEPLGRAAQACAASAGDGGTDHTVDLRGWRPAPELREGPGPGGFTGVLQSEQNLLIHLTQFPDARGLRLVIDSQRVLSNDLAHRVNDDLPGLAAQWARRAATYTELAKECRNIAGLIGDGRNAAAEGSILLSRMRKVPASEPLSPEQSKAFVRLFNRIDARITSIIEAGAADRLYFLRVKLPRVTNDTTGMVHSVRERYVPITSHVQTDLLRLTREGLRPRPSRPDPPPDAAESRRNLQEAILHRPATRSPSERRVSADGPAM